MSVVTAHSSSLISARNVVKHFGDRAVLQNISIDVEQGKIVTLIGPNGAGKTTLVRILLGLTSADQGHIERRRDLKIGYMPQKLTIDPTLPITIERFLKLSGNHDPLKIRGILDRIHISHLFNAPLQSASGGEMQRVLLARALLGSPNLLVLDEPAQGVDVSGQAELYELIGKIRDETGCGVIMISHDLHIVMSSTDEVVCLNHHVCCHGEPEQVSNDPAYLELFGANTASSLAVYTHNHNHEHDLTGEVTTEQDH
jgi:zinc transport system ATP-binding protein